MRTIIAGSRGVKLYRQITEAVNNSSFDISVIISGTARGADKLGEIYAARNDIPCEQYPADWDKHGRSAGYIRNSLMADNADALIAIWDGESRGTKHMIDIARRKGLKVWIQNLNE